MQTSSKKLIAVLGPTSSGKSDYAIRLAREVDSEIISVDSRQVYRGMDIGTGKIPRDFSGNYKLQITNTKRRDKDLFFSEGIRHHLLDVASPKREYNVTHFLRDAKKAITDIEKRGKVPILCGGTTFWVEALLLGTSFPEVKPDKALRAKLSKLSVETLFKMLQEKDHERTANIDAKNKVRLIRALEIIETLGKVPSLGRHCEESSTKQSRNSWIATSFDKNQKTRDDKIHIIALNPPKEILHARIEKRLKERLKQGMVEEVKRLHNEGVSWKRLEGFGLEYRWCTRLLQEKISREDMEMKLLKESKHYAKRQLTFLRRLERNGLGIEWITKASL
ncbi:MAG: tRNA (adenosine(37)-N6)-dimethylallyltransferase MiaA [Candidatus Moranbacteria bacterium]|nr:tRNA (adenosine(37)-N6)-dimethylallyltransferase MiaA [Candidatus Moranbacteria bacterium]